MNLVVETRVRKKSVSMQKLKLRALNAENCVNYPEDAIHKKNKKGGCIPLFLGPLGPPPSLKKKEDRPQSILKKKGVLKKKGDEHFCVFWKQQNAFWNFIFKMKRTFSKDHEHPKIPRPGILSDLCRNFTLI